MEPAFPLHPGLGCTRDDRCPGRPPAAAHRGPQRRDPDRAQAAVDQGQGDHGPGVHRSCAAWCSGRACTRSARRPAAPTSTSAGRTARPPSSSAATSAPGAATSARSTPASRPSSTPTSRAGWPSRSPTMGLRYATVTGVARDDLPDGGAWLYAETVRQIHALLPGCGVELLIPDFNGEPAQLRRGLRAPGPRCSRTTSRRCRASSSGSGPAFRYDRSLDVITQARDGRAGHQVQPDPRPGRGARRGLPGAARPARRRLRADHHHAVPAARRRATTRWSAG